MDGPSGTSSGHLVLMSEHTVMKIWRCGSKTLAASFVPSVTRALGILMLLLSAGSTFGQDQITIPRSIPLYGPFELNVQGSTSEGGSQELIAGRIGQDVQHSATGKYTDIVFLIDSNNDLVDAYLLGDLAYGNFARTRPSIRLPDGQLRCWPRLLGQERFNGGYIGILRPNGRGGGVVLDLDPIVLRR